MLRLMQPIDSIGGFSNDFNQLLWPTLAPDLFAEAASDCFLGAGTSLPVRTREPGTVHVFSGGAASAASYSRPENHLLWCVRGPLTAHAFGGEPATAITDGIILAPQLARQRPAIGAYSIGVMPRYESLLHPGWPEASEQAGFELLSPVGPPLDIVDQVRSLELLLTESLHGAILADTFGVPWLPFATNADFNQFKWVDWAMSVQTTLKLTAVPPPDALPLLLHGRPRQRWGNAQPIDADTAVAQGRLSAAARRRRVAAWLADNPTLTRAVQRTWKLGPQRTAASLVALSRLDASVSPQHRRRSLAVAMLDRLDMLCRLNGVRLRT